MMKRILTQTAKITELLGTKKQNSSKQIISDKKHNCDKKSVSVENDFIKDNPDLTFCYTVHKSQ